MMFIVSRTSAYDDDEIGVEGATRMTIGFYDRRTLATPEEHDARLSRDGRNNWADRGTEHRIVDGKIERRLEDEKAWAIDLPDLAAVIAFVERHGECVLKAGRLQGVHPPTAPEIEVYDDYRE
jgi:hypothetical protein